MVVLEQEVERWARERWNDPKYAGPPSPDTYQRAVNADQAKHKYLLSTQDLLRIPHVPFPPHTHHEKVYLPEDLEEFAIRKYGEVGFYTRRAERIRHEKSLQREQLKESSLTGTQDITGRKTDRKIMRHKMSVDRYKETHEEPTIPGI